MVDRIFPISIGKSSWDGSIKQSWDVQLQESASGLFRGLVEQDLPSYEYDLKFPHLDEQEKNAILGFFAQCKGALMPFYINLGGHIDNQQLAKGTDGKYPFIKVYGSYVEPIGKVENVTVFVNGVKTTNYTIEGGKLSVAGTGTVTATYDYYEYVRFGKDLSVKQIFNNLYSVSLKVVTAR